MRLGVNLRSTAVLGGTLLLLMPLLPLSTGPKDSIDSCDSRLTIEDLVNPEDASDVIAYEVTMRWLAEQAGETRCLECGNVALCLHPDTSPEDAKRILRELPT
jgi:hypothetical protein